MGHAAPLQHIPILLIDVADFTSQYPTREHRRTLLRNLQQILSEAARFFMPYGNVWAKWHRHGTGDGYYFLFDAMPAQVALEYALRLTEALERFNQESPDLQIRLRQVLAIGDVEWVDDQILSDAFTTAERLISYGPFKEHSRQVPQSATLASTDLFRHEVSRELAQDAQFAALSDLTWTLFVAIDKHGQEHRGYVLGEGWEEPLVPAPAEPPPFRVVILIGHSVESPLPEAIDLAKVAVEDFKTSELHVEIRVDQASLSALRREAQLGCDLLIYYGHGTEDGHLSFVDGRKAFTQVSDDAGLGEFWQDLPACFLFACYGDRFADQLPGPWLAFAEPILTTAPRGFIHALIDELDSADLAVAVTRAQEACATEMTSSFAKVLRLSERPLPSLTVPPGTPSLSRVSPALTGQFSLEFVGYRDDGIFYPEHDPFIGRDSALRTLLRLPTPYGDEAQQRAVWVHGDAGMGKSALLRQFAVHVRDLVFSELDEPVFVLHIHCHAFTSIEQLVDALCARAGKLYGLEEVPATLGELARAIEGLLGGRGTHIWILDDLTYLTTRLDDSETAARLVQSLLDAARAHVLRLQLTVSSRRPGPKSFEAIPVGPLSQTEALQLAAKIWRMSNPPIQDPADLAFGASQLFSMIRGATAHYKRALRLAVDTGVTYRQYAEGLSEEAGLEALDLGELASKMVAFEVSRLHELEERHGFRYGAFLSLYYPLITRAAWFTSEELIDWFGDRLAVDPARVAISYKNGLSYLLRLNFVMLQDRAGTAVLTMPPNQRWSIRALENKSALLPEAVPLRGARERLSLALEGIEKGDLAAVGDFLSMESDYRQYLEEPTAAAAVFQAMLLRAGLAEPEAALPILDEISSLYFTYRMNYPAAEIEAMSSFAAALFNKGVTLGILNHNDEAIQVYDQLLEQFQDRTELPLQEPVARALFNKGVKLGALNRNDEAIQVYDQLIQQFQDRNELPLQEQVAKALVNKGVTLGDLNRNDEAIQVYDQLIQQFQDRNELPLQEQVAKALNNKVARLAVLSSKHAPDSPEAQSYWQRMEATLQAHSKRTGKPLAQTYNYACLLALRRQSAEALHALEECLKADEISVAHVRKDSDWSGFHSDPEFQKLLETYDR